MVTFCGIYYLILAVVVVKAEIAMNNGNEATNKCTCGVFRYPTPERTNQEPMIVKSPNFDIKCEQMGRESCASMCMALAEAAREKAPKVLCELVGETKEPLKPMVYFKTCGSEWTHTNLTAAIPICCNNKVAVSCDDAGKILQPVIRKKRASHRCSKHSPNN